MWRTLIYCGDPFVQCAFSEGLTVLVVGEEIYRLLFALLIATFDKFAQLLWKSETQMLFGQVDQYGPRHGFRSPETEDKDAHRAVKELPRSPTRRCVHELLRQL